jgi:hypothetical protein
MDDLQNAMKNVAKSFKNKNREPLIDENTELPPDKQYKPRENGKYNLHWRKEVQDKILSALRGGNTRQDSYLWAGIDASTFYSWLDRRDGFDKEVIQAEAHAKVTMVTCLKTAATSGSWQAALAWLERRYPREWGKVDQFEVGLRTMTQDELREFITTRLGLANAIGVTSVNEHNPPTRSLPPLTVDQDE